MPGATKTFWCGPYKLLKGRVSNIFRNLLLEGFLIQLVTEEAKKLGFDDRFIYLMSPSDIKKLESHDETQYRKTSGGISERTFSSLHFINLHVNDLTEYLPRYYS